MVERRTNSCGPWIEKQRCWGYFYLLLYFLERGVLLSTEGEKWIARQALLIVDINCRAGMVLVTLWILLLCTILCKNDISLLTFVHLFIPRFRFFFL